MYLLSFRKTQFRPCTLLLLLPAKLTGREANSEQFPAERFGKVSRSRVTFSPRRGYCFFLFHSFDSGDRLNLLKFPLHDDSAVFVRARGLAVFFFEVSGWGFRFEDWEGCSGCAVWEQGWWFFFVLCYTGACKERQGSHFYFSWIDER